MTCYQDIAERAAACHLSIFGAFHPTPQDGTPASCRTLLLLGPREPGFWAAFSAEAEARDGKADPIDRWSRRVIGTLACDLGAKALFPFTGPPWHPFFTWATRSGRAWQSPVSLLVHDTAGLMVSYRGALALKSHIDLPEPPKAAPCETCSKPCLSACPVEALTRDGYDVPACHTFLDTAQGADCMENGCRVRRTCPVSQSYGRRPEQSAFHMQSFHP